MTNRRRHAGRIAFRPACYALASNPFQHSRLNEIATDRLRVIRCRRITISMRTPFLIVDKEAVGQAHSLVPPA